MKYRYLLALTLSINILPSCPIVLAASQDKFALTAIAELQPSNGVDTTLFKSRWSLPSNGAIQPIVEPHAAQEEAEDFPTPASVEAEQRKAAAIKKASKQTGSKTVSLTASRAPSQADPLSPEPEKFLHLTIGTANNGQAENPTSPAAYTVTSATGSSIGSHNTPQVEPQINQPKNPRANPLAEPAPTVGNAKFSTFSQPTPVITAPSALSSPPALSATPPIDSPGGSENKSEGAPLPGQSEIDGSGRNDGSDNQNGRPRTAGKPETQAMSSPAPEASGKIIQLGVSVWDSANVSKIVEHLVDLHIAQSEEAQALDKSVRHYRSTSARTAAGAKDVLNQTFFYQGTDPSQRMGKLVLSDQAKIRDHATAEFERQKYVDKIHSQIVSSMAQIATGLGTVDSTRRQSIINAGIKSLNDLVGEEQAALAAKNLTSWLSSMKVPASVFKQPAWDTMERDAKLEAVIRTALEKDPVVAEIKQRVARYANPATSKKITSKAVTLSLNTAALLSPGFAIPIAAEAALDSYVMMTGGTEESKLEKELVYDKRIQSRLRVLNTEASLALDNYRFALVTKNAPLLSFSEALIADMSSEPVAKKVLVRQTLAGNPPNSPIIPEIKESIESKNPARTNKTGMGRAAFKQITGL
jgi:hypothetical protein